MALTSIGAVTSTLVAVPSGRKVALERVQLTGFGLPTETPSVAKKLPPLSPEQVKANIENDKSKGILTLISGKGFLGFRRTSDSYKFNPDIYKTAFKTLPNFAQLKQRYNLPDGIFKDQLYGYHGDKDTLQVRDSVSIPVDYIDKFTDKK